MLVCQSLCCYFYRYRFKVEDAASLKDVKEEFKHLRQLNISLYDCEDDSSDEEEEQEDAGVVGRASVEVASFFLQSALQLEVILMIWKKIDGYLVFLICRMNNFSCCMP